MSNYPIWWDKTITIFNKYEDKITDLVTWYKYTVSGCFWKYIGDSISIGTTILETNGTVCRIPENPAFLPKYKWIEVPNYLMVNYFTLGVDDIIILDEVDDYIDEYTDGHRSSDIISKYKSLQGCIVIKEIAIDVGPGRCNPHYRVKGE